MAYAQLLKQGTTREPTHEYTLFSDIGLPLAGISPTRFREALSQFASAVIV